MNKVRIVLSTIAVLFAVLATNTVAYAQAARTWVSGVGDDVNPCSRTAPCKTFAGAIAKTAPGGIIDVLDPGGFGAVTITKAITIDGGGSLAGVLVAGTNGIVVQAGSTDVVRLVNLDIEGLNSGLAGVLFLSGSELVVQNCRIYQFTGAGIDVATNDANMHVLTVANTDLDSNAGGGILIRPAGGGSVSATVNHVRASMNGSGVSARDSTTVTIHDSVANSNTGSGFEAVSSSQPVQMNIVDSVSMNQNAGASSAGVKSSGAGARVRLTNVSTFGNSLGLSIVSGASLYSFGNLYNAGNSTDGMPTGTIPPQ